MMPVDGLPTYHREYGEPSGPRGPGSSMPQSLHGPADPTRLAELERENSRLQLLVAELLIKNQQLRRAG